MNAIAVPELQKVSVEEVLQLGAVDSIFFSRHFFPRTARMASPPMHRKVWEALERPGSRLVNLQLARDMAKTSILRMFTAKRIAYGISHTILYIGQSEGHAVRSVDWIRKQIKFNSLYNSTFRLRPGSKFQGTEAEIYHGVEQQPIWILAAGIWGSVRGINLDDYRPDLIVLDDVIKDVEAASAEGRKKLNEMIMGAVKESLAPATESPDAKLVMLNTPNAQGDASMEALKDQEWFSLRFPCWTLETENADISHRVSSWPERHPSETLRKEKAFAIARGQGHIFAREKECRITSPETAPLRREWLNHTDLLPPREEMVVMLGVDPVPKPTPHQIQKGMQKKDFECYYVWGRHRRAYYLLDFARNRGHEPDWSVATFISLLRKWRPRRTRVDSTAYQSTLAWLFQKAMQMQGVYSVIDEVTDNRSKYDKIIDTLQPVASAGQIFLDVHKFPQFVEQWSEFPDVQHDDDLDASHLAVGGLLQEFAGEDSAELAGELAQPDIPLEALMRCP